MKRSSEQSEHLYATKKARVVDGYGRSIESMDVDEDKFWIIKKETRPPPLTAVRGKTNRRKRPQPQSLHISSWVFRRECPHKEESQSSVKKSKHRSGRCMETIDVDAEITFRFRFISLV
ncbi:uncharacterized protein LOC134230194 [Saccostrea cucullata]|uniref:uncharacterized protein LOC134230194 n=1 Tax=Saccostrea cuccullata TaxID=36930 RepID=UPI002ED3B6A5